MTKSAWLKRPMRVLSWPNIKDLARMCSVRSSSHTTYLSKGKQISSWWVSSSQPRTICSSARVPSASSFSTERFYRQMIGSAFPPYGRFARKIASGTAGGCRCRLSSVSKKTQMRSSMKLLVRAWILVGMSTLRLWAWPSGADGVLYRTGVWILVGMSTLRLRAWSSGTDGVLYCTGAGASGRSGLWSWSGSQFWQRGISFERSITISENEYPPGWWWAQSSAEGQSEGNVGDFS
jgi:hypothetical protein